VTLSGILRLHQWPAIPMHYLGYLMTEDLARLGGVCMGTRMDC